MSIGLLDSLKYALWSMDSLGYGQSEVYMYSMEYGQSGVCTVWDMDSRDYGHYSLKYGHYGVCTVWGMDSLGYG